MKVTLRVKDALLYAEIKQRVSDGPVQPLGPQLQGPTFDNAFLKVVPRLRMLVCEDAPAQSVAYHTKEKKKHTHTQRKSHGQKRTSTYSSTHAGHTHESILGRDKQNRKPSGATGRMDMHTRK